MKIKLYKREHIAAKIKKLRLPTVISIFAIAEQIIIHPSDIYNIFTSIGIGTSISLIILLWGILSYRNNTYRIFSHGIKLKRGVIQRNIFTIPYKKICVLTFCQGITERLTGAVSVYFDTKALLRTKKDIPVCLPTDKAEKIHRLFSDKIKIISQCGIVKALISSIFLFEPTADFFLLIPFFSQIASLTGTNYLKAGYNIYVQIFISHNFKIFLKLFFSLWLISVLIHSLRLLRFSSGFNNKFTFTQRGIITKIISFSRLDSISAFVWEQSILMHLLGIYNIFIHTTGFKPHGQEKNLFAPAQNKTQLNKIKKLIFPYNTDLIYEITPPKRSYFSYTGRYFAYFIILIFWIIAGGLSSDIIILLLMPVFLRRIFFSAYSFKRSYASLYSDHICICTQKGMKLKCFYIPLDRLKKITIKQNPFQRKKHTCSMCFHIYSEKDVCISVKHIDERGAYSFLHLIRGK